MLLCYSGYPYLSLLDLGVIFPCPPHACLLLGPALLGWQGTEVEAGGTCGAVEKETAALGARGTRVRQGLGELVWGPDSYACAWVAGMIWKKMPALCLWEAPLGTPPSFARPPFLSTPEKRVEVGGRVCSLSRSRRVIANVCVVPALFTKPCHVYKLLFDSFSHLTSQQKGRAVIVLLLSPYS